MPPAPDGTDYYAPPEPPTIPEPPEEIPLPDLGLPPAEEPVEDPPEDPDAD